MFSVLLIFMGMFLGKAKSVCDNQHFSGISGSISSPNYPMAYAANLDCYSYISIASGHAIIITFSAFSTEVTHDWVTITCTSGDAFTSPSYSGSQIPAVLTISSCNQVTVYFHTDASVTSTGFSLTYNITSVCGKRIFSGPTGTISSPNYPNAYANNLDCYSYISVLSGHTIFITFLAFTTESQRDWVTFTCASGNPFRSPRYSGTEIPTALIISSCNVVNVSFHSDGSNTNTGFSLTYNITADWCNRNFSGPNGKISSTNFPMAYKNNPDCFSYISVPSGQTIIITFLAFNTESRCGWVTITCVSGNAFTSPRYSGSQIPAVLTISSCNLVNVSFRKDSFSNHSFSLTYDITSDNVVAGFTTKPLNAFPRSDKNNPVIFNCTTASKYLPWWTMNAQSSSNYTITNSTCEVINSAPYSSWFMTETLGPGSCNLIVVAPANSLYLLAGSFVCTDSTLSTARAIIVSINLELRSTTVMNSLAAMTDIIRDEKMRISCNPTFTDQSSSPSDIFTYSLYSGGPIARMRILRTYWTSQGNIVPSANNFSVLSNVVVKAPKDGIIPQYTCNIVFDFVSNIYDLSGNFPFEISISTESLEILYWPTEDNMTIIGDNNGQIRTPALLYCNVAANPPATYTWIDESSGNITKGPTIIVNHGGRYTCNASNIIRGQYYQQSKSVTVQVLEDETHHNTDRQVSILGALLGVTVITTIILLAILLSRKYRQLKKNTPADVGHDCDGNEHELRQRDGESYRYATGFGNSVDVAESENDDLDDIYENMSVEK